MIAKQAPQRTETDGDPRRAYVEASIQQSIDNLVAQGYPRRQAEHLVECLGRERFEREAHASQTQGLWEEASGAETGENDLPPDGPWLDRLYADAMASAEMDAATEPASIVVTGQGDHAQQYPDDRPWRQPEGYGLIVATAIPAAVAGAFFCWLLVG